MGWSIPVSAGYGRRLRFLVWDQSNGKLMGLLALGDPVMNLRARDVAIAWTFSDRRARIRNVMDAYVLGAVPPYTHLLGGKVVAALVKTTDVLNFFCHKYCTNGQDDHQALALITTSSALGKSSLYNRLALGGRPIFASVGFTSGWGHFHVPDELFALMREYLRALHHPYSSNYQFGDGPNWRLRAIRETLKLIGLDTHLLRHTVQREVFLCPLARNTHAFLRGGDPRLDFADLKSVSEIAPIAISRWVAPRSRRNTEYATWKRDDYLEQIRTLSVASCESSQIPDQAYPYASGRPTSRPHRARTLSNDNCSRCSESA